MAYTVTITDNTDAHVLDAEPVHKVDLAQRVISATWTLGPTTDHYGEPVTALIRLECSHINGRLTAQLRRWDLSADGIESTDLFGGVVTLRTEKPSRFNRGALVGFAADQFAAMPYHREATGVCKLLDLAARS